MYLMNGLGSPERSTAARLLRVGLKINTEKSIETRMEKYIV